MAGDESLLWLIELDAELEGATLPVLAGAHRDRIARAIREFRADRDPDRLVRNGLYALGATIVFVLVLWGLLRLYTVLHRWAERRVQKSIKDLADKTYNLFHPVQAWRVLAALLRILRIVLVIVLVYFYLNAVLGLFPWTRPVAVVLLGLILDPLKALGAGMLSALPNLFFLAILFIVVRYILKLIRAFFTGVNQGRIRFENFDQDWAIPTYKIVRVLVVIFAVVIAYPYIPGSDSLAFKGASVFLGVLLSLGSSSFIAHTIAGLTMTYRGAFKEGDVVRIGDVTGEVEDIKLLVTRIRTPKNEVVIVPNSNILNTDVVNYSRFARDGALYLHSVVGIGYDAPWRQVEAMLLEAVRRTDGLLQEPPPFVLQKSLGDFTVNYEVNAACRDDRQMPALYSRLHANIQDVFNEHGVQIMSPHYVADSDPPKVVPKEKWFDAPAKPPA
ncbi:MAG: mechanosensitive ion channel family protein [Xanthomonadales bacterium]|nr:mechanosensitive ion channel family protein [Xanthomonadales bacterium]